MINKKKILNKVSNEKNIRKLTETEKKDLKNTFLLMTQEIDMVCKKYKRHYFFSSEESKLPKLVTPHRIKPTISSYLNQSSILAFDGLSSQ